MGVNTSRASSASSPFAVSAKKSDRKRERLEVNMTDATTEQTVSPLVEPTAEPSLDELFGIQPELPDDALRFFVRQERQAMRAYHARVEEKRK